MVCVFFCAILIEVKLFKVEYKVLRRYINDTSYICVYCILNFSYLNESIVDVAHVNWFTKSMHVQRMLGLVSILLEKFKNGNLI